MILQNRSIFNNKRCRYQNNGTKKNKTNEEKLKKCSYPEHLRKKVNVATLNVKFFIGLTSIFLRYN